MEENKQHDSEWLEKLQRESWNLELLISGFSIFLLIKANQGILNGFLYLNLHTALNPNVNGMLRTLLGILFLGSIILTINLIAHVFLRGFWIGAVGLRSVQDKIDIDKLGYSDYFTKRLKPRVPSLDRMLEKLDTLSSVIFSFTFLIVFMFFSLFLYFSWVSLFAYMANHLMATLSGESIFFSIIQNIVIAILIGLFVIGMLYAIDTLTIGFFKKFKWTSKIFYPVYKVVGWMTLASVYRSIYYSLASRFSKGKIRTALIVYLLPFFLIPFVKYDQYIFYPDNADEIELTNSKYDDLRKDGSIIWNASIPSQVVDESFLPLFIRYRVGDNNRISKICSDFQPLKKEGFNSGIYIWLDGLHINEPVVNEKSPEKSLDCFNNFFNVKIDSTKIETDFYLYTHTNEGEKGIQTMLDVKNFPRGKHEIIIEKKQLNKDDEIEMINYENIIFWKE